MENLVCSLVFISVVIYFFAAVEDIIYRRTRDDKFNKYTVLMYLACIMIFATFSIGF